MSELKRENGSIYYEVSGEGLPLVCLRGLGRSIRHWLGYDQELAKHFQVITMDMRGMGRTTAPHGVRDTMYDLASDVVAVLDEIGVESAHIMGVSLGGMVALAMGLTYPDRCRSLIVINTSIGGQRLLRMSVPGMGVVARGIRDRERIHVDLSDILVGSGPGEEDKQELAKKFKEIADLEGPKEKQALRQLLAAARFRVKKKLMAMNVPTLVVYGTDDRFVPPVNSKKLFELLPDAHLVAVQDGGHELFVDKGQELLVEMQRWTKVTEKSNPPD